MPQDLLITGFGSFPGVKVNPSARLAVQLARDRRWSRLGLSVRARVLDVGYSIVREALEQEGETPPKALLMFGVAARAKMMRIEIRAINRVSRTARDARRALPATGTLEARAGTFRYARANAPRLLTVIRKTSVATKLSRSAGRYVCNAGYWHALGVMPNATSVIFVHIPMLKSPTRKKPDSRPDFPSMLRGAKALAHQMIIAARLRR